MTKPSSLYGAKRRASIRKGKESKAADEIREKMKNWMPHHMPALHKLPVKLDEYEHQLKAFTTYIQNEYSAHAGRISLKKPSSAFISRCINHLRN